MMNLLRRLYNHPTLSDEVGTKKINRTSIVMMVLFAPLSLFSLILAIFTANIFLLFQSSFWFVLISFASMSLQSGSNSARKGMMIISAMNFLGGLLFLSISNELFIFMYSSIVVVGSVYTFVLMWGTESLFKELSARRKI